MDEQADRETLAEVIGGDPRGLERIIDAILASDWLAEVKRAEREAGARDALLNAADDLRQGRLGISFGEVADELEDRAAALGTGEEGQG